MSRKARSSSRNTGGRGVVEGGLIIEELGITPETHVVLYDTIGVFSSPRGLYTFKAFGHDRVSVLDGG